MKNFFFEQILRLLLEIFLAWLRTRGLPPLTWLHSRISRFLGGRRRPPAR
jgi:hypothetical protein